MDSSIFLQLSLILVIVTGVSIAVKLLKQPLILGYILTGLLVGPSFLHLITNVPAFEGFSEIGIALLLFIIGMGLNVSHLKKLGKPIMLAGLSVLGIVGGGGFVATYAMGFTTIEAALMGLALFFSSTIIIVKVLSDKKEQNRLHGQIAIGVILLDDIIATLALLFVAASQNGGLSLAEIGWLAGKGALLGGGLAVTSLYILPKLSRWFATSQELLFLFGIAWGFGIASLFEVAGFSIEVGALFAGVSLARLPYAQEMASRLRPLRDFFVVLFFIVLGESLNLSNLAAGLVPALILSLMVIVLKPLVVAGSLGLLGYTKRTSFKAGINLSQVSEFSIILIVLAVSTGLVNQTLSAIITLVAIITITTSTYLTHFDNKILEIIEDKLYFFEGKVKHEEKHRLANYSMILFGYRKGGHEFVKTFKELKKRFVVVDYDPEVIETLERQHIQFIYGDASDHELLEEINVAEAKLIVSTMTDFALNEQLVKRIRTRNQAAVIVCHASDYEEAAKLYRHGVTYVMMPHFIGSERISAFIKKHGTSKAAFDDYRQKHLINLGRAAVR